MELARVADGPACDAAHHDHREHNACHQSDEKISLRVRGVFFSDGAHVAGTAEAAACGRALDHKRVCMRWVKAHSRRGDESCVANGAGRARKRERSEHRAVGEALPRSQHGGRGNIELRMVAHSQAACGNATDKHKHVRARRARGEVRSHGGPRASENQHPSNVQSAAHGKGATQSRRAARDQIRGATHGETADKRRLAEDRQFRAGKVKVGRKHRALSNEHGRQENKWLLERDIARYQKRPRHVHRRVERRVEKSVPGKFGRRRRARCRNNKREQDQQKPALTEPH
eukprot:Amastigsp_a340198_54.p2 type:complete len:287 gc:universal Amastigsp_a340198_54:345-1205(+)